MAAKLRKGDEVIVLAGKDKGKKGTVTLVVPKTGKAIVDGVNMAIRHERQTQTTQGGRLPKSMPIDISNLSCLLYTSPSPRDMRRSRMPSSA